MMDADCLYEACPPNAADYNSFDAFGSVEGAILIPSIALRHSRDLLPPLRYSCSLWPALNRFALFLAYPPDKTFAVPHTGAWRPLLLPGRAA
ncbi:MAG: hypothetical protein ACU836_07630 [Gammaproteobacteria bacterium]